MKYLSALILTSLLALVGCDDGPAENFGEEIDESTENAGESIEEAADDVEDSLD